MGSVCEDRGETDMAFGVHLGNIESHFHGHYGRVLSESNGGRQDIKFQVCAVAKVPHNKRLNSIFVLSFMTDRVYLLLYLLNEINE